MNKLIVTNIHIGLIFFFITSLYFLFLAIFIILCSTEFLRYSSVLLSSFTFLFYLPFFLNISYLSYIKKKFYIRLFYIRI